ncbi:MAG: DUF4197 domain-containing protein [Thiogranum sp.]|nr:DUF4197 domain-containing protein [Thiogranum sp.]
MVLLLLLFTSPALLAAWSDWRQKIEDVLSTETPAGVEATQLSQDEIVAGLKEALQVGVERATSLLGQKGGFLNDAAVKIPLPEPLKKVERGLRAVGQDAVVDEFVMSMNRAAEKAVPEATSILADTIKNMSLRDARSILNGPDDAATQYFRAQNEARLTDAVLPIVKDTTAEAGVTSSYKRMTGKLGPLAQFADMDRLDLDQYIAGKTLDGLFLKLAQEEKRIREDPVARSTELLKKVFASSR